jgi:hypothetical protein
LNESSVSHGFFILQANIMLVLQAKAFYLFLLFMGSHGDDVLGSYVDAEGPDLDGASTLYSRPGPPNLFGEDNKEVRNELIKAARSSSFEAVAHPLPLVVDGTLTTAWRCPPG